MGKMNLLAISIMVICGVMHQSLTSPLQNGCKETPLDVIAVLDGSESITDEKFTQVKIALEQLIRSLRLQYHDSRFGVVLYSSSVSAVLPFSNNEMDLINRIRALEQPMEGTQTHLGLEEMNKMFRMEGRPHAAKVGIVFTDGISKNKVATSTAARESIRTEINMFSIGTSMDINMEELQIIASSNDRVLSLETISEIYNHLKGFIQSCGDIGCKDYMDVVTVVDGSDSISHTEFESVKNAVKEFVQELSLESPLSRFSLVLFSSNVSNVIDFTHNKADLLSQIDSLEQPRDGTDTAAALEKTNALMNISGRQGVPKIIVVITDGYSKNSTQTIIHADEAKNMGINVFSIGITDKKQDTELVSIASDIDKSLVLEDFKELSKLVMEDVRKACGDSNNGQSATGQPNSNNGQWTNRDPNSNNNGQWTNRDPNSNNNGQWTNRDPNSNNNGQWTNRDPNSNNNGQWATRDPNSNNNGQWTNRDPNSNNNGQWTNRDPNSNNNGQGTNRDPNSNNNGQWTNRDPNTNNNGQWTNRDPNSNNNGQGTNRDPNSNNNGQGTNRDPNSNNNGNNGDSWTTKKRNDRLYPTSGPSGPIVDPSVIDPLGLCDNCTMRNGVGFNSVAGSCQKFIQCIFNLEMLISTILKDCPAGLFWDQDKLTCNYASEVDCTEDPCYSKPDGDIAHPTNCREYYTCFNSVSFEKCCLPGYAFNAAAGKCESNSACVDSCKWGNPEEGCTRREIADKHSYEQAVGDEWIVMSCPLGALYSQEECKCGIYDEDYVNTPPPPAARDAECKPSVQLSFDSGTYDESGNFNYVQNNGVVVESGVAYFDGQSFLRIPRFANVDFRKTVTIKMKYKLDGAATGQEALVTNGDCGEKQSIYIVAEQSQTVLGLISADSADEKSATIASSSDWNEVEYKVVDGELISAVNGRQANTIVDGIIKRKHCSLQIGRGDGFDNFKGWIDELSVYLCAA